MLDVLLAVLVYDVLDLDVDDVVDDVVVVDDSVDDVVVEDDVFS